MEFVRCFHWFILLLICFHFNKKDRVAALVISLCNQTGDEFVNTGRGIIQHIQDPYPKNCSVKIIGFRNNTNISANGIHLDATGNCQSHFPNATINEERYCIANGNLSYSTVIELPGDEMAIHVESTAPSFNFTYTVLAVVMQRGMNGFKSSLFSFS